MYLRNILSLLIGILAVFSHAPAAADKPVVIWTQTDFPPFYIPNGPLKNQGVYDSIMEQFFELLPGFEHRVVNMTIARSLEMMARQDNVCNMGLIQSPERDKTIVFSQEITRIFRNTLIIRRWDEHTFRPFMVKGEVDLDALLHSAPVRLTTVRGRRYGKHIDAILADRTGATGPDTVTHSSSAVRMLVEGHTDAIIAFPQEALYAVRTEGTAVSPDALMSLPIKNSGVISGRIGCSKGAAGEQVIRAINDPATLGKIRSLYVRSVDAWSDQYLRP